MTQKSAPKKIVLTGCTRGLGRALCEFFVARGQTMIACGRSDGEIKKMRKQFGEPHVFAAVDVSDAAQTTQWAERVLSRFGAPDMVINNAAVIAPNAPLWKVSAREFDQVIDVNIKGVANVIRAFVPPMISAGRGVIVNFSSGWGRSTAPDVAPYCASKWAIEGLTQALAQELPDGFAAVALNPGIIDTAMLRSCFGESAAHYPQPALWAQRAGPFILQLGPKDNGRSLDVPGIPTD